MDACEYLVAVSSLRKQGNLTYGVGCVPELGHDKNQHRFLNQNQIDNACNEEVMCKLVLTAKMKNLGYVWYAEWE